MMTTVHTVQQAFLRYITSTVLSLAAVTCASAQYHTVATKTVSMNVSSAPVVSSPLYISTQQNLVYNPLVNRTTGKFVTPLNHFGTKDENYSVDIELGADGTRLYWIGGAGADRISSATADGSNVHSAVVTGLHYGTGLAVSPTRIFYADYTPGLFSTDLDGSDKVSLTGPGKIDAADIRDIADIEYANNKIYFVYYSFGFNKYRIMSANTDGSSPTEIYATSNYIKGLYPGATQVYWTEFDQTVNPHTHSVMKKSLTGGAAHTLAVQSGWFLNNLVVDENNAAIYVVAADARSTGMSELRKVSTSGGILTPVLSVRGLATSLALRIPGLVR